MKVVLRWVPVVLVALLLVVTPVARPASADELTAAAPGMAEDERAAVAAVNGYWQRHFTEFFDKSYSSPRVFGGYVGSNGPSCGSGPSQPMNAFYCPPADFLAWDENLMALGYRRVGDSWVYLIIAHEWGHAIQARLSKRLVAVADELQADCLAGAALVGAARDGLLSFEPGDEKEIGDSLTALADESPWTSRRDHGDAQQRVAAFNKGSRGGVRACF